MSTQQNPQVESQKAGGGREANGRFARGNMGGPGNPFARQAARMRQAFSDRVSDEKLNALIDSMVELGIGGNIHAAKLVFHYVIGKPSESFNPDRMDQEEFNLYKEGHGMCSQAIGMVHEPDPHYPLSSLRILRAVNRDKGRNAMMDGLRKLDKEKGIVREPGSPLYVPPPAEETPIGNGDNGAASTGGEAAGGTPNAKQSFGAVRAQAELGHEESTQSPIGNGDIGNVAPIGNGSIGRGPELFERYGPKMSRRALKKARRAAKMATMMPSKNGKH